MQKNTIHRQFHFQFLHHFLQIIKAKSLESFEITLERLNKRVEFSPIMDFLDNSSLLITGATGSFGKKMVSRLLSEESSLKKIVIFSRDELKQFEMQQDLKDHINFNKLRFFLGDVRDLERLKVAFKDINYVIHAAALKQVPAAEYNPFEFIKTNVLGAQNIIEASLHTPSILKVIALSTDKAASPVNLYGATKLCADKLFVAGNNYSGDRQLSFSVVRYGNVMGSRGSVVPFFLDFAKKNDYLPITHEDMTRFNISLDDGVSMVLWSLENAIGGEIYVPRIPSYKVTDLAKAIGPNHKQKIVGIRPGEKIHEVMISNADSYYTIDLGDYFVITSRDAQKLRDHYISNFSGKLFPEGEEYDSGSNEKFLSVDELKKLIL